MKYLIFVGLSLTFCNSLVAQSKLRLGLGYYGETIFHPGIIVHAESDLLQKQKLSVPIRVGMGYYFHRYNHQALFADLVLGIRWHLGSRIYTGLSGGIGLMNSWHHSDHGVFKVGENGDIQRISSFAGIDFMPSINAEIAYKLKRDSVHKSIWLRPIVFFQNKVNDTVLLHFAMALGYTF
ncbi:MAG: hypothetical protein AAFR87_19085 [Bacteroidota bacterium]